MLNRKQRRAQKKQQPAESPWRIDGRPVSEAEGQAEWDRVALDLDMNARVTFTDDPAVALGSMVTGMAADGRLEHDTATTEQVPVALFEPTRTQVMVDPVTKQATWELHTVGALDLGMHLVPYGVVQFKTLQGWRLGRGPGGLELDAPGPHPVARSAVDVPPAWVSAAASHRYVLVLHGIRLGVRIPPGARPQDYTAEKRRAELIQARRDGLVTGGLVRWEPAA
jgi:hypothetical protein